MQQLRSAVFLAVLLGAVGAHAQSCCGLSTGSSYTGQVATRTVVNDNSDQTNRQIMVRSTHFARSAISSLQIVVQNMGLYPSGCGGQCEAGQTRLTGVFPSATVTASVEYPPGTCTQIKFSSSATGNISTGTPLLLSDAVTVSIPKGAQFWVRQYIVGSAGALYTTDYTKSATLGDAFNMGASGISDQTVSCDSVSDIGSFYMTTPAAIVASTTAPAACIVADSIGVGEAVDGIDNGNANGDSGAIAQSVGPSLGYIKLGVSGLTAADYLVNSTWRRTLYKYCSHMFVALGHVEMFNGGSPGGSTAAQVEANLVKVYAQFPGVSFSLTQTPTTSSTDNWATTTNQTPFNSTGFEAQREQLNADLLTTPYSPGGFVPNGGVFDIEPAVGTGTAGSLWNAGPTPCGAPNYWVYDGIHPTLCANTQAQNSGFIDLTRISR